MTGRLHLTRRAGLLSGLGLALTAVRPADARDTEMDHDHHAPPQAAPGGTELLPPFGTAWGIIDPVQRPDKKPIVYGATAPDPAWLISQWGIGGQRLPAFGKGHGRDVWVTRGPTAMAMVSPREIRLEQHGRELECEVAQGQAREFDLFLSPAEMPHQSITAARHITLSVAFEAKVRKSRREAECKVTQGATLVAFVLGNARARQTLFHQIHFQVEKARNRELHEAHPRRLAWFWKQNPFGVDEYLGNEGRVVHRSFDILPLLRRAIESAPAGLDRNLQHWTLNSTYAGQHIWGGATITSTWREYSLVVA